MLPEVRKSSGLTPLKALLLFVLFVAAYFFTFFFRVSASVVLPEQARLLGMSASLTGFISSLYYYAYAVLQPFCGALHDRFGPVRVAGVGMVVAGVGIAVFLLPSTPASLGAWRLLTGLGLAPVFSGALVYQASAFPRSRYPFYSGITLATGNFGAVASVAPLGYALDSMGKTPVFLALTLCSLLMAFLFLALKRSDPVTGTAARQEGHREMRLFARLADGMRTLKRSRHLLAVTLLWAVPVAGLLGLQGLWAVSWYATAYESSEATARNWATLISVGVMIGTLLGGYIAPLATQRKRCLVTFYTLQTALWMLLWSGIALRWPLVLVGAAGGVLGIASGVTTVHFASAINDVVRPDQRGVALGCINMLVMITVILFQWGTGGLLDLFPGAQPGTHTHEGYLVTFAVVIAAIAAAAPALRWLDSAAAAQES